MSLYADALDHDIDITMSPKKINKCWLCNGSGICTECDNSGKCLECEGSGLCPECDGDGKCRECADRPDCSSCGGTEVCSECQGSGKCSTCQGLDKECPDCNGSGVCFECDGDGDCPDCFDKLECSTCKGSETCPECQGSGKCPECEGPGLCPECEGDAECPECKGSGVFITNMVNPFDIERFTHPMRDQGVLDERDIHFFLNYFESYLMVFEDFLEKESNSFQEYCKSENFLSPHNNEALNVHSKNLNYYFPNLLRKSFFPVTFSLVETGL